METPDTGKIYSQLKLLWQKILELKLYYLAIPLALLLPAFFFPKLTLALALMTATVATAVITRYYELSGMGIELATFSTVITAMVFEPKISGMLAFTYIVLQMFAGGNTGTYIFWVIPSFTLAGFLLGNFTGLGVTQLGIYTAVSLQAFFVLMTSIFSRGYVPIFLKFVALNIIFNFILFTTLAEPLLNIFGI